MITASWATWVEINPDDRSGDWASASAMWSKSSSPHGNDQCHRLSLSGIRPDVVAVPIGQGHRPTAASPAEPAPTSLAILPPADHADGELAWAATRVKIETLGRQTHAAA